MYLFPRAIHADSLSVRDQIKHLASEIIETKMAYASPAIDSVAMELYDVIHSAETCVRMLDERHHIDDASETMTLPWGSLPVRPLYEMIKCLPYVVRRAQEAFESGWFHTLAWHLRDVVEHAKASQQILASVYHVDIEACRQDVINKNKARGYYEVQNDQD
jgi:hypothetical protein